MEITRISEDNRLLVLQVEGEDETIIKAIHLEILKDDRTVFAGVYSPHPLMKKVMLKVESRKVKPTKIVEAGSAAAVEKSKVVLSHARELFKKGE